MAAPTFVDTSTGNTDAASPGVAATAGFSASAGNVFILQVLQDGTTAGITADFSGTGWEDLAGTDGQATFIGTFDVGSPATALQHLWIGRVTFLDAAGNDVGLSGYGSEDIYCRIYSFSGVSTGTTLADVIENGTAGSTVNSAGTSATIADADVTTLGADRLALNFVAGNDDNAIDAFTGMSGGTWAEAVAEYAEASGTDGVIQLQTATIASAGTIGGGTDGWADATDSWGVVGFALKPVVSGTPHTVNPSDSVALADARTFSQGQAQADSVALADAFSRVSVSARAVDDSVALADARALSVGKALADSVALTDSATPVLTTDHVVQPSDSVALSDALTISWTQDLAGDTVALSDSFSRVHVAERSVSDSVVLSDQATPVNEAGGTDHTVNPDDSLSLSDTFSRVLDYARTQSDGINLTDQALDAQGIRLGDMVALTDALARVHEAARQVADSVALTDAVALSQGELIADAVALSDQLSSALDLARTISDSVSLSDATTFSQGKAITDAVALADQLTRVATFARDIADSVALTDQVTPTETGEGEQAVDDFITLSDQFSRVADFARTIADSVLVSDAVTMDRALLFSDLVGLTDQVTAQEGQGFTEAINDLLSLSDLVTPVHVVGPLPTLPGVGGPSGPLRPGRRKRRERIQAEEEEIITVLLSEL